MGVFSLGKDLFTFGNGFAECGARRTGLGKKKVAAKPALPGVLFRALGKTKVESTRQKKAGRLLFGC